jgi:hypothetical protein
MATGHGGVTVNLTLESLALRVEALERKLSSLTAVVEDPPGTVGDAQSDDAEAVARWIAAFDAIPPMQMTPDEEAAWQSARLAQKQIDADAIDRLSRSLPGAAG